MYKNTRLSESYERGLYYPVFLLHRYFFIFIVFALEQTGPCQASLMIVSTTLFLLYLLRWRPFSSRLDMALTSLSTVVLIVLYLFCLLFAFLSRESSIELRLALGLVFIALVLLLFAANVLIILLSKVVGCIRKCRSRKQPRKFRNIKAILYSQEQKPETALSAF